MRRFLKIPITKFALDLSPRYTVILVLGIVAFFLLIRFCPPIERYELDTSHFVEFRLRHWLGKDPALDPRVHIYAMGDSSLAELKKEGLDLQDWAMLFKALSPSKPRAVIVDKVFSAPTGISQGNFFNQAIVGLGFPVIAGGFVSAVPIPSRSLIPLQALNSYFEKDAESSAELNRLSWLPIESGYPYGPASEIADSFTHIGHLMYAGNLNIKPILRLSRHTVFPSVALYAAKSTHFHRGILEVDGSKVPQDRSGRTLINLVHPTNYFDRTFRLSSLLQKVRKGEFPRFEKDSVIIFLPALYTGSGDLQPTPFGIIPGGFLLTAVANSILTGKWVTRMPHDGLLLPVIALAGFLVFFLFSGVQCFCGLVLGVGVILGVGVASFVWFDYEVPWLFSTFCFLSTAVLLVVENMRVAAAKLLALGEAETDYAARFEEVKAGHSSFGKGIRLGRYHILELLGAGGMGEVYRAKTYGAGGFEKEFALKRIQLGREIQGDIMKQFEEEARLDSILTHANIAQVLEFFRMKDTYVMVLEYVDGKTLAHILSKTKSVLPLTLSVYILREICQGLEYAHSKKNSRSGTPLHIVHRDISPQNVMVSYEGAVKIIDFGIAKVDFQADLTVPGTLKGKFAYMSPEQAEGKKLDQRSDIFSAGLVFYELLTGVKIMKGDSDLETLRNVLQCRLLSPAEFNPEIPPSLNRTVMNCLAKDPKDRYPNATILLQDLRTFLEERPSSTLVEELSQMLRSLGNPPTNNGSTPVSNQTTVREKKAS